MQGEELKTDSEVATRTTSRCPLAGTNYVTSADASSALGGAARRDARPLFLRSWRCVPDQRYIYSSQRAAEDASSVPRYISAFRYYSHCNIASQTDLRVNLPSNNTPAMPPSHVLIIGAGLGGPAMALALARNGIRSTLYERRASCQDIGGVLSLAPNAVRVLDKIVGVEQIVRPLGSSFNGFNLCLDTGYTQASHLGSFGDFKRAGYQGITIKRPVLHQKLVDLCKENELVGIEYNKRLTAIEEGMDKVTAIFEDGTKAEGESCLAVQSLPRIQRQVCQTAST